MIEALRVLREVRDWTDTRRVNGTRAQETQAVLHTATQRVELAIAETGADLVPPIGPVTQPPVARSKRAPEKRDHRDAKNQEIPLDTIDPHALSVVRRLRRFGFKAYLVGGCVRDLLLGLEPKDFDIATDARPEEVKSAFRNSRIIGRRFRLVHLYFRGGKILEVSTFRANNTPDDEDTEERDLLVRRDNVFGTEEEDARRRDFTINGLFYDVASGRIIDHVGGLEDVRRRELRMIGDPDIRLREDPVRILRAIRFQAKTNLRVDPELAASIRRNRDEIVRCAPARVLEETLRLLRIGHSAQTVSIMDETGVLGVLLPRIRAYLDGDELADDEGDPDEALRSRSQRLYAHLEALDHLVQQGTVSDVVVMGALLYDPLESHLRTHDALEGKDFNRELVTFLDAAQTRLALTKKITEQLRQAFLMQRNLGKTGAPGASRRRRRRPSPESVFKRPSFSDALNLYEIHLRALELPLDEVEQWYEHVQARIGREPPRPLTPDVLSGRSRAEDGDGANGEPRRRRRSGRRRRRRR